MMDASLEALVQRACRTEHGFRDLQQAADELVEARTPQASARLARDLYASQAYQVRSVAVFVLGRLAAQEDACLVFLRRRVGQDPDWHVQEILAKAFDRFCSDRGYELALPEIESWLSDPDPRPRRAVTEGLRIWTRRPYFCDHPEQAIQLLSRFRADADEALRRSAGNALRDISRSHPALVLGELQGWDRREARVRQTYALAARFLEHQASDRGSDRAAPSRSSRSAGKKV